MLLCADMAAASADLASGVLACPSCGAGRLRAWGYGRERAIRVHGGIGGCGPGAAGAARAGRPTSCSRRGRCRGGRTPPW